MQAQPGGSHTWHDGDTFQEVLLDKERVMLTTDIDPGYHSLYSLSMGPIREGRVWDYAGRPRGQRWLTTQQLAKARDVQEWLWAIGKNRWIGKQLIVTDPERVNIKKLGHKQHSAFITIHKGDKITCLSPQVWIWCDSKGHAGEWCVVAAPYTTDPDVNAPMDRDIEAGLVPISTVAWAA